jgi:hypothetical protein
LNLKDAIRCTLLFTSLLHSLAGAQGFVLHCPDCGHKSQELLTQQAVLQHIQQHLSTAAAAAGTPCSTLQAALDAGCYSSAAAFGFAHDHPADVPAAKPDVFIQELMAQVVTATALHIIVATGPDNGPTDTCAGKRRQRKQAPLPVPPPGTEGSQGTLAGEILAAQAVPDTADGSRRGAEQRCRQRQRLRRLLLPWRSWAADSLLTGLDCHVTATCYRPGLGSCNWRPERLCVLELVLGFPFVDVTERHCGYALEHLAVLLQQFKAQKESRQQLAQQQQQQQEEGMQLNLQKKQEQQQQQQQEEGMQLNLQEEQQQQQQQQEEGMQLNLQEEQQEQQQQQQLNLVEQPVHEGLGLGSSSNSGGSRSGGHSAADQCQGAAAVSSILQNPAATGVIPAVVHSAANSGTPSSSSSMSAGVVQQLLSELLTADVVFRHVPAQQRVGEFLQQLWPGSSVKDVAAAAAKLIVGMHLAVCYACGLSASRLRTGLFHRCKHCMACLCGKCLEKLDPQEAAVAAAEAAAAPAPGGNHTGGISSKNFCCGYCNDVQGCSNQAMQNTPPAAAHAPTPAAADAGAAAAGAAAGTSACAVKRERAEVGELLDSDDDAEEQEDSAAGSSSGMAGQTPAAAAAAAAAAAGGLPAAKQQRAEAASGVPGELHLLPPPLQQQQQQPLLEDAVVKKEPAAPVPGTLAWVLAQSRNRQQEAPGIAGDAVGAAAAAAGGVANDAAGAGQQEDRQAAEQEQHQQQQQQQQQQKKKKQTLLQRSVVKKEPAAPVPGTLAWVLAQSRNRQQEAPGW